MGIYKIELKDLFNKTKPYSWFRLDGIYKIELKDVGVIDTGINPHPANLQDRIESELCC